MAVSYFKVGLLGCLSIYVVALSDLGTENLCISKFNPGIFII
jgi:hypothetical protein